MLPVGNTDRAVLAFEFHIVVNSDQQLMLNQTFWSRCRWNYTLSRLDIRTRIPRWHGLEGIQKYAQSLPHLTFLVLHQIIRETRLWFSEEVRNLRKRRWKRFRLLDTDETKSQYQEVRNTCASTLCKSRRLYGEKLVKGSVDYTTCLNL